MRRRSDDELYMYPAHMRLVGLGEYRLPVSVPLRGLAAGAAVFVPALTIVRWLGAGGLAVWALAVIAAFVTGVLAVALTSAERPVRAVLAMFAAELSAPRPGPAAAELSAEFGLDQVRVRARRPRRRGRRWRGAR
jgi:hypothetical protein